MAHSLEEGPVRRPWKTASVQTVDGSGYVAVGGDQYEMLKGNKNLLTVKLTDSDVLRRAIQTAGTIAPQRDGRVTRLDKPGGADEPCKPAAQPAPAAKPTPTPGG